MRSFPQNVIKHKVGLLNLATELGNVSRACKVMGFSRDTFYRYQSAVESVGVDALPDADLALQFQAIANMPEPQQAVIKQLLEGMIIKYEAERWSSRIK
jgi:hypothetical protein